jgi:hypothetical protein
MLSAKEEIGRLSSPNWTRKIFKHIQLVLELGWGFGAVGDEEAVEVGDVLGEDVGR